MIKTVRQASYMLDVGVRAMRRPLSLRARLVLAVIALATVGLAVANVVTYTSLRSFLLDRTDQELRESTGGIARELDHGCPGDGRPVRGVSPGTTIQLRREDGSVFCTLQATGFGEEVPPGPDLPAEITAPVAQGPGTERSFTVDAVEGDERYRVQVSNEREGMLIVAMPLADVDATLDRLIRIEVVVTALVLGALRGARSVAGGGRAATARRHRVDRGSDRRR